MIANPYSFIIHNRNKLYFFESTGKRTIQKLVQFSHVEVFGVIVQIKGLSEPFQKGIKYEAFLIKRK
jgi:hypothetical protein